MSNPNSGTESSRNDSGVPGSWLKSQVRRLWSLEALVLILVVLASSLAMSPNVADPDLWGHVQYGRDVLTDNEIAATTTYSYTANGYRWVNHENLSEIAMAIVTDSLGPIGLIVGKFLLGLVVILAILRANFAAGCGLIVSSMMTLLVAANLGYHWSIRPQVSSFVCFVLLLLLFQYAFSGWRERWHLPLPRTWFGFGESDNAKHADGRADMRTRLGYDSNRLRSLWFLAPLMLVWGNSHGGFAAGLAVIVVYLALRSVEALCRGKSNGLRNEGWGIVRRMMLMAAVAVAVTLINPYGPELLDWLAFSIGNPRPEISDWANIELWTIVGMKLWLMVACTGLALVATRRRLDATHLVILALLLWQAISHFRHVPFFAIAAGYWIGPHLQSALNRFTEKSPQAEMTPGALNLARALILAGIVAVAVPLSSRLSDLRVERDKYPVDAIEFVRSNNLSGRFVVTYDWAQYVIAALCSDPWGPQIKSTVAFDGRFDTCYPQTIIDMHFDFLYGAAPHMRRNRSPESPPVDPARVLQHGQPDLVLLRRFDEQTEKHMYENADTWILLYQDAIAQVWGRSETYDDPQSNQWIAPDRRVIHNRLARDSVTWPAIGELPKRDRNQAGNKLTRKIN